MWIYEYRCLLYLLFLVVVDLVQSCPAGCTFQDQTLICTDLTNSNLPELYTCVNNNPLIQIVDIRSHISCSCEMLYLTNHHKNKDLLVFAPVDCSNDNLVRCGFKSSIPKNRVDVVEIAGKMFEGRDSNLHNKLNKHVEHLVGKLNHIRDPKQRLQYLNAIFLNTKDAVAKLSKERSRSPPADPPTTTQPVHPNFVQVPHSPSKSNPLQTFYKNIHWNFINSFVHQPHNRKEVPPVQVHVPHLVLKQPPSPVQPPSPPRPPSPPHSPIYPHHFQPLHRVQQPHQVQQAPPKVQQPHQVQQAPPKSQQPPTKVQQPPKFQQSPHYPFYPQKRLGAIQPPYQYVHEKNGWEHLVQNEQQTTSKPRVQVHHGLWREDENVKLIIFGCLVGFILLVILVFFLAMTDRKEIKKTADGGDLDLKTFKQNTSWEKFKGKLQTEYRRPSDHKQEAVPKHNEMVDQTFNKLPQTNLQITSNTDGVVAVSGLTSAVPQQPVLKEQSSTSDSDSPAFRTMLLYRESHRHEKVSNPKPNKTEPSTFERAVPSPGLVYENPGPSTSAFHKSTNSIDPGPAAGPSTSEFPESKNSIDSGPAAESPVQLSVSPRQIQPTPVSSDDQLEKNLYMKRYGHKSGYTISEDVKGTVRIYEPKKIGTDEQVRKYILHQRRRSTGGGYSDEDEADTLQSKLSFGSADKDRLV